MKYYVITFEQVHTDQGYAEYATKGDPKTEKQATSDYYDKCSAINKDLGENGHSFADVKVVNSTGGIIKDEKIGKYVETVETNA